MHTSTVTSIYTLLGIAAQLQGALSSPVPLANVSAFSTRGSGAAYKLGLAWDYRNPSGALSKWPGAGKIYTWSVWPPSDSLPDGMEWYPMLSNPGMYDDLQGQISSGAIKPGMTILGYNEPDQQGQANLAVGDAVSAYKSQLTPLASKGYRLASPACTSDDNGFNWISSFMSACSDCQISAVATHFYGTDADAFKSYISKIHNAFGLPVIVSEWAAESFGYGPTLSLSQIQGYLGSTQAFCIQQGWIESYFYFGPETSGAMGGVNPNNRLITDSGDLTDLGYQYWGNGI